MFSSSRCCHLGLHVTKSHSIKPTWSFSVMKLFFVGCLVFMFGPESKVNGLYICGLYHFFLLRNSTVPTTPSQTLSSATVNNLVEKKSEYVMEIGRVEASSSRLSSTILNASPLLPFSESSVIKVIF